MVLGNTEYIIHEYQRENGVLPTLEKISMELVALKEEAEKIRDDQAESIYWPLINAVLVTVNTSIAHRRIETYEEIIRRSQETVLKISGERSECIGEIKVLNEVRLHIVEDVDDEKKAAETGPQEGSKTSLTKKCREIAERTESVVENLKAIENEHENIFHDYLKSLGNSCVNSKVLKAKK